MRATVGRTARVVGATSRKTSSALGGARARHRATVAQRRSIEATRRTATNHRKRLLIVLALLAGLFGILATKVVDLQVVSPGRYLAFGQSQRADTQVLPAERGAVLDRNGDELAISRPTKSVFVDPALIDDAPTAAALVAPILGLTVDEVQVKMTSKGRFQYLARKVHGDVADKVKALALPGVAFLDDSERYLPGGNTARSLLGTVDVDNEGAVGPREGVRRAAHRRARRADDREGPRRAHHPLRRQQRDAGAARARPSP